MVAARLTIIVGGADAYGIILDSGMIYDARTELWTPLPNDMPEGLHSFGIAGNDKYLFVIGGMSPRGYLNTVYRLSLETFEWTTMAPMSTNRCRFAAVRKGDCIYVFGGVNKVFGLRSVERYSITGNGWEILPVMEEGRYDHCAVAGSGDDIYIVGGVDTDDSFEIFDTASLLWESSRIPRNSPKKKDNAAAVLLKDHYLVLIGGLDEEKCVTADCLIYDIWSKNWSVTPPSIDILKPREYDVTAAVLDGKIVVADGLGCELDSEFIYVNDILEYAPLHYPLPLLVFDRILEIGKAHDDRGGEDKHLHKKAKIV